MNVLKNIRLLKHNLIRKKEVSEESFIKFISKEQIEITKALDLGSGPKPRNIFSANKIYGVDIRSWDVNDDVYKCNLSIDKIPFPSNHFDCITAFDVLEHIPRVLVVNNKTLFPFVNLFNEVWRVLKPGGYFFTSTPCFPYKEVFQDPTHVNTMTEDTIQLYFTGNYWARIYGFHGSFELIKDGWNGSHYLCMVRKSNIYKINKINEKQIDK